MEVTPGKDLALGVLPWFHIYGQTAVVFSCLKNGIGIVSMPTFTPELFVKCLQAYKVICRDSERYRGITNVKIIIFVCFISSEILFSRIYIYIYRYYNNNLNKNHYAADPTAIGAGVDDVRSEAPPGDARAHEARQSYIHGGRLVRRRNHRDDRRQVQHSGDTPRLAAAGPKGVGIRLNMGPPILDNSELIK